MKSLLRNFKKPPKKLIIVYAVSFFIVAIGFAVLYFTVGKNLALLLENPDDFKAWLDGYKGLSAVVFVAVRTFQTIIKVIPGEPLEIAAGYVFGTWGGLLYCSLGSLLGTLIILLLSRRFGKAFVSTFVDVEKLQELPLVEDDKRRRLFLIAFYLIPSTPKDLMCYGAGLTKINLWEFLLITTLCRIPSIITSTVCGNALGEKRYALAIAVFVATAVAALVCMVLYKRISNQRKQEQSVKLAA